MKEWCGKCSMYHEMTTGGCDKIYPDWPDDVMGYCGALGYRRGFMDGIRTLNPTINDEAIDVILSTNKNISALKNDIDA